MSLEGLIVGGRYAVVEVDGYPVPEVTFLAADVRAVEARLDRHYVSFEVRLAPDATALAYHAAVPDLRLDLGSVVVAPRDEIHFAAGQAIRNGVRTVVVDDKGRELVLDRFTTGLQHDFTHLQARAAALLADAEAETTAPAREALLDQAIRLLADATDGSRFPGPHWLMGRCLSARGGLNRAVLSLVTSIRHATSDGDRLVPFAASPLTDLALAMQALGDARRARFALAHGLRLRPAHAEALVALARLCPDDAPVVEDAVARCIVLGREDLAEVAASQVASATGGSRDSVLARGRAGATRVDLGRWPFATAEYEHVTHFVRGFDDVGTDEADDETPISGAGVTYRSSPARRDAPMSDPGEDPLAGLAAEIAEDRKRPWWKIW